MLPWQCVPSSLSPFPRHFNMSEARVSRWAGSKRVRDSLRSLRRKHVISPCSTQPAKLAQPWLLLTFACHTWVSRLKRSAGYLLACPGSSLLPGDPQPALHKSHAALSCVTSAPLQGECLTKHFEIHLKLLRKSTLVTKSLFCSWK